jgi:thiosulfate/3-mercaptopyruvate sulfurtransferase
MHILLALLTATTLATGPRVVSTSWLAAHLNDPDLVVLHVGPAETYATHIPGARRTDLAQLAVNPYGPTMDTTKLMVEMLPPDVLRAKLESYGISDKSTVVVYAANDEAVVSATRVVFTLRVAGLGAQAALLDGGLPDWTAEKRPLTADVPHPSPGHISATPVPSLVVDADWVRSHLGRPGIVVIDARDRSFYDGTDKGFYRFGHIAGAQSLPYTTLFDSTSERYKSPAALKALFRAAGAQPGDTIVGYCHIGMQATAMLFAADQIGYPVRLYDGSFQEWSKRTDLPVDDPAKRSR